MIAEVAHRNRRRVWNCLPKQVHAGCLDYAAVVTCPAFATTLENGRFDKCHGASRMSEKGAKLSRLQSGSGAALGQTSVASANAVALEVGWRADGQHPEIRADANRDHPVGDRVAAGLSRVKLILRGKVFVLASRLS